MSYKTEITNIVDGKEFVRGYALSELIRNKTFAESIYLVLKGELPNQAEAKMIDAMFTAGIDHGPGTASAQTARIAASAKNSVHTSIAAGILAMGELHGSAIEGAAKFYQENFQVDDLEVLLKSLKEQKIRVPGYGHSVLKVDERSEILFEIARENDLFGKHCEFALKTYEVLNKISSKQLPINIDGAMAAILSDMGFDYRMMKGFFIIARVPGLMAHIFEESTSGPGLRRMPQEEIEYTGAEERKI